MGLDFFFYPGNFWDSKPKENNYSIIFLSIDIAANGNGVLILKALLVIGAMSSLVELKLGSKLENNPVIQWYGKYQKVGIILKKNQHEMLNIRIKQLRTKSNRNA